MDAEENVAARVLELVEAAFLEVADESSATAWLCRCFPNRFDCFFFLVTSAILKKKDSLSN